MLIECLDPFIGHHDVIAHVITCLFCKSLIRLHLNDFLEISRINSAYDIDQELPCRLLLVIKFVIKVMLYRIVILNLLNECFHVEFIVMGQVDAVDFAVLKGTFLTAE